MFADRRPRYVFVHGFLQSSTALIIHCRDRESLSKERLRTNRQDALNQRGESTHVIPRDAIFVKREIVRGNGPTFSGFFTTRSNEWILALLVIPR